MRPLESTIQIFLMHSSLESPSFTMAMVISSAIPIAACEQTERITVGWWELIGRFSFT